ncbi:MaoC/PaaZ C-terminal domain-containing protein [Rhizobium sp. SSA_523]|uniref:MaoC/PaaZ C-terminal domain-containing protein n=1 Tax=Rhizobium sp. SSA_523 TaxID=2952477 RepID=UPI0020904B19|nr:MaoC/PaaZ C-terminal domain-containing protein [Rhizobium sp. SSA_523]MCO5731645.1 MaoC family dehydratase N-terminal domain-containing protein [Rhizobium sp. SSA_523]WKC21849.1 MaoC/PaaZ C-terminal domain-containing protein [Rhizobium sp. SSA_523]
MALNEKALMALDIPPVRTTYDWRDSVLYALGLGYGDDPIDPRQLRFVTEEEQQAMPAMANVLGHDGSWMRDAATGIDYLRVVHGEQSMHIRHPLPVSGEIIARTTIEEVVDKGEGKGALVTARREIEDARTGLHYATIRMTIFCRGAGGFGGKSESHRKPHPQPDSPPARSVTVATPRQLALIYRLSGDYNPLHSRPETAAKAGFERPILHGLATFGIACRALMQEFCASEAEAVKGLEGRFSAPVYPGETVTIDIWPQQPGVAAFSARVGSRDVLKNGRFEFDAQEA